MKNYHKGLLITAAGVLVISPDGLLTRLIETDHWTMIFWRALFLSGGMALLLGLFYPNQVMKQYATILRHGWWMVAAYSAGTIFFISAITHTSVAHTLIILSTTPLFAAMVSWLLLREIVPLRTLIAIAVVVLGVLVMSQDSADQQASLMGDIMALAGAFFLATGFTLVRKFPGVSSLSAISVSGLVTALLVLPLASPLAVSSDDMGYLMVMGIYMVPLGSALMFMGPRYIPSAEVGLLLLLESVLGPLWVWLVIGDQPGLLTLLGGGLVLSTLAVYAIVSRDTGDKLTSLPRLKQAP